METVWACGSCEGSQNINPPSSWRRLDRPKEASLEAEAITASSIITAPELIKILKMQILLGGESRMAVFKEILDA